MMRDPDLDQAIIDLRPTFAQLREAKAQLKHVAVRASLKNQGAVEAVIRDSREHIAVRAGRLAIHPDGLTVILSAFAREKLRLKRWPSAKQVTAALRAERSASALEAEATKAALARAHEAHAAALRADAAVEAACIAYTGYPN